MDTSARIAYIVRIFGKAQPIGATDAGICLRVKRTADYIKREDAIRKLRKIRRFSPFFLNKTLDEIIDSLERYDDEKRRQTCGKCISLTIRDDGVYYCNLYKCAKPWDGYCEKWRER